MTILPRRTALLARLSARTLACATAVSLGVALVGTPQQPRPHIEGEDHLLTAGLARPGFDRRTDISRDVEMVGLTWEGDPEAVIALRGQAPDGVWTEWTELVGDADEGPDASSPEHRERLGAGPTWLGHDMGQIETRVVSGEVTDLRLHAIDTEPAADTRSPFAVQSAQAAPGSPLLVTRAQWGADESWRNIGNPGCDGQPHYASGVRFAVVHHTVSSNSYAAADVPAILRGIYDFHTYGRGWCDVAYNFFVDRFGRGFEGRFGGIDRAVIGGHTGGFNTGSTGVAMIGDFETASVPGASYSALRSLLAWKLAFHGVDPQGSTLTYAGDSPSSRYPPGTPVVVANIEGHRDTNLTSCPGRYLYALLPQLRRDVAADVASMKDQRLTCDWDGDGVATAGYFFRGVWYLRGSNASSAATTAFGYGNPTDRAVCGDWDGNGTETVGVVRNGVWYLRQSNSTGGADLAFGFGDPGDRPVVGDWDGNGTDTPGVFRSGRWYLANRTGVGWHDVLVGYGDPGDVPVVGNWDGSGADGIGVFRRGVWYLANSLQSGGAEVEPFGYGDLGDAPLAGDWDDDGDDTPGVSRGSLWYLSTQMRAATADMAYAF
jgi:hypothetical protein